ncbi:MAG: hypothetical protein FWF03_01340 [Defluviitaleaceae bacterium]|nr:hypothetical protein [Defluviitaleaceae bacterium]
MNNRFKMIIAALLAVVMVLALAAACGGSGDSGVNATNTPTQAAGAASDTDATPKRDIVTLSFKTYHAPDDGHPTHKDTPLGQLILEKFGVIIDWRPSNYQDALQDLVTDIAAGTITDMFCSYASPQQPSTLEVKNKAAREGVLEDISGLLNKYPVLNNAVKKDNLSAYFQRVVYNPDFDGSIYFLPTGTEINPWVSGWGLYIRGDVAEALNVPIPDPSIQSTNDFYNLLVRIRDGNFVDINGREIYPLGFVAQWTHIVTAMTRPFDFGGAARFGIMDGKVMHQTETNFALDQVMWVRRLAAERLLDPEALSHTYDTGVDKMTQARYGVTCYFSMQPLATWGPYSTALHASNPEMTYQPLGNMVTHRGTNEYVISSSRGTTMLMFKKGANVDRWLEVANWASGKEGRAAMNMGVEGENWFWNSDGYAQFTDASFEARQEDAKQYGLDVGVFGYITTINPTDALETNPFGGRGDSVTLQNDPGNSAAIEFNGKATMPNVRVTDALQMNILVGLYDPDKYEILQPLLNDNYWDTLLQCYLAGSDAEAKTILDGYVDTLKRNGLDDLNAWLWEEYNKDLGLWADYTTEVQ